jgi:Ni,Fe-hydrogenase III component G
MKALLMALLLALPAAHAEQFCDLVTGERRMSVMEGINNVMNRDKRGNVISQSFHDALFTLGLGNYTTIVEAAKDESNPEIAEKAQQVIGSVYECEREKYKD